MARRRTYLAGVGAAVAGVAMLRHLRSGPAGLPAPGGILMRDAVRYDQLSQLLLGSFYRSVASDVAAAAPTGARLLEVGCGPGHLSIRLARDHAMAVTGLDLDPAMIERARANAERAIAGQGRPTFAVGDVAALPFPDGSFDLVVSTLSLHHWADPMAGAAEIGRVMRPGGRALVWDLRPGIVPLHGHMPDPLVRVHGSTLHVVDSTPWRWPWRLALTQRIELVPGDGTAQLGAVSPG